MIQPSRRSLITGLISLCAAPAIVRYNSLMPVKSYKEDVIRLIFESNPSCLSVFQERLFYVNRNTPSTVQWVDFPNSSNFDPRWSKI